MIKDTLLFFSFLYLLPVSAQEYDQQWSPILEARMAAAGFDLVECGDEKQRDSSLQVFRSYLDTLIEIPGSFERRMDTVKNLKVLYSPDNVFRILTWTFRYDNDSLVFFGLIQFRDETRDLIWLSDSSNNFYAKEPLYRRLDANNWYGALYYQIVASKHKKQTYYTLVGWNGKNGKTDKKILDVMYFDKKGKLVFGAPMFKYYSNRGPQYRVVWEYANGAGMIVRHEEKKNVITFENLNIPDKKAKGLYYLYFPDGTYDYFKLKRGVWVKNEMLFDTLKGATED